MSGNPHTPYVCPQPCEVMYCVYCEGGLTSCTVCGGAESSLTTHCYGEKIGETMLQMVSNGQADFVDGEWIRPNVARDLRFK